MQDAISRHADRLSCSRDRWQDGQRRPKRKSTHLLTDALTCMPPFPPPPAPGLRFWKPENAWRDRRCWGADRGSMDIEMGGGASLTCTARGWDAASICSAPWPLDSTEGTSLPQACISAALPDARPSTSPDVTTWPFLRLDFLAFILLQQQPLQRCYVRIVASRVGCSWRGFHETSEVQPMRSTAVH